MLPHRVLTPVRRFRARAAALALASAAASTAACYTTRPLLGPPAPGTEVEATLNDRGREALADSLGREVNVVRGRVVERTDTSLVMSLTRVRTFSGAESAWTGERVRFPMTSLRALGERRVSRTSSVLLGGAIVGAALVFILSRTLGSSGSGVTGGDGPGGPPSGS